MPSSDIAIIGLACRFPGDASSPAAFFEMLLQGKDAWAEIPSTRFNAEAYFHPNRERPGTMVRYIYQISYADMSPLTSQSGLQGWVLFARGRVEVGCPFLCSFCYRSPCH
jgi:hypothetical protein